jgi:predicted nucleotidyltransferase
MIEDNNKVIVKTVLGFYPDVEAIYLFGTFGSEEEWPDSDVDIALLFPHSRAREIGYLAAGDCRNALEVKLKKEVDLVNLRKANTVFQNQIIQEGRILFQRDSTSVDHFEMDVMSSYQKLNEERAGILEEIVKSGRILN